ncbi:MAG: lipid A oxidase [Betaproteobacteria bacterium]|nr:lipid A oxidase [Betaproteobacteria bacterium]
MTRLKALVCTLALSGTGMALAESEFQVFSGIQASPHSTVHTAQGDSFFTSWDGKSMSFPIYFGWRYTHWVDQEWGYALNFAHAKAYADPTTRAAKGFTVLEFTDGANPLTVMAIRRFEPISGYRPYAGLGAGISIPHVEEERNGGAKTFGYQYGGPVLQATGGFSYELSDKWQVHTELQVHYLKLDTKVNGGRLKTNLVSNAVNIGASYRF